MRTFAIMHRPKGSFTYTNHYHQSEHGHNIATIHGDLEQARKNRDKIAEDDPAWDVAVFEMIEVTA